MHVGCEIEIMIEIYYDDADIFVDEEVLTITIVENTNDPCARATLTFQTNPPIIPAMIEYTVGDPKMTYSVNK